MKQQISFMILLSVLVACSASHFDRYPGKSISSFPDRFIGEYRLSPGGFKSFFQGKQLDSVRSRIWSDRIETLNPEGWITDFKPDSNNVLSRIDTNYYFLSQRDVADSLYWNSSLLWGNDKEIYLYGINSTDKNLQNDKLKNYLQLKLLVRKGGKESIQTVNYADKALLKQLSKMNSDTKDSVLYYQMYDEQLLKFIKKEVNAGNSLRFVRIKNSKPKQ